MRGEAEEKRALASLAALSASRFLFPSCWFSPLGSLPLLVFSASELEQPWHGKKFRNNMIEDHEASEKMRKSSAQERRNIEDVQPLSPSHPPVLLLFFFKL